MFKLLLNLFRRDPEFIYGTVDGRFARKHRSGRVDFIKHHAGMHGWTHDIWASYHPSQWHAFKEISLGK